MVMQKTCSPQENTSWDGTEGSCRGIMAENRQKIYRGGFWICSVGLLCYLCLYNKQTFLLQMTGWTKDFYSTPEFTWAYFISPVSSWESRSAENGFYLPFLQTILSSSIKFNKQWKAHCRLKGETIWWNQWWGLKNAITLFIRNIFKCQNLNMKQKSGRFKK